MTGASTCLCSLATAGRAWMMHSSRMTGHQPPACNTPILLLLPPTEKVSAGCAGSTTSPPVAPLPGSWSVALCCRARELIQPLKVALDQRGWQYTQYRQYQRLPKTASMQAASRSPPVRAPGCTGWRPAPPAAQIPRGERKTPPPGKLRPLPAGEAGGLGAGLAEQADPLPWVWKLAWKLRGHSPHSLPAACILRALVYIPSCVAL